MVYSADLKNNPDDRPVARQLYYSILKYMNFHLFLPEFALDLSVIEDLTRWVSSSIFRHYAVGSKTML